MELLHEGIKRLVLRLLMLFLLGIVLLRQLQAHGLHGSELLFVGNGMLR